MLRVKPLLKLVCDRVLFFPARAWVDDQYENAAIPAGSEKEFSKPPANGVRPAGLPLIALSWHVERGHGNLDKPQFAGFRWPSCTRVVVLGQGLASMCWPSELASFSEWLSG
jgi:hypothetical protein